MAKNDYRFEIADQLVERLTLGESMTAACQALKIGYSVVARWNRDNVSGFRTRLIEARQARGALLLDEILQIADDAPLHAAAVARAGLQIRARMFVLERLCPAKGAAPVAVLDESPEPLVSPQAFLKAWTTKNVPVVAN